MEKKIQSKFQEIYGATPSVIARAPGRIEFIGNHTDYNEGTVLGASIDRNVWVALRLIEKPTMTFFSDLSSAKVEISPDKVARQEKETSWVNYPLGVWSSMKAFKLKQPQGFEYLAMSDLPTGAGLSSSAAIELASALAFTSATVQSVDRETLIKLCKHAENNFVGVPCGILDQGVSGFGKENHLVYIDCRGPKFSTVALPSGVNFWIFNTHTKHALVDSFYSTRHKECMDAAKALGVKALADVSPTELESLTKLPNSTGKRARHVIEEIDRVEKVILALQQSDLVEVGRLLTASHKSSQTQFENSTPELDFLVDTLIKTPHVYGARLTGGGFGGAVLAVTNEKFSNREAEDVSLRYKEKFGKSPEVLQTKTGMGAELAITKKKSIKAEKILFYIILFYLAYNFFTHLILPRF